MTPIKTDPRLIGLDSEPLNERLYRRMLFIRKFEQRLLSLFDEGILNGTTHACIGQEVVAVSVMEHLKKSDHVFSNHRCHGHYLAFTGDAVGLMAEIMGLDIGICAGLGGSQHICAPGFKSNGVQGGIVPAAAGIALGFKLQKSDSISVVFIGDGTLGEGIVYEALNISSLWKLPILFVLENNEWAQSTSIRDNLAGDIESRFKAFNIPVTTIDSRDVLEISEASRESIHSVRKSNSPRALIIHTYRLCHHSKNDDNRPKAEVEAKWQTEPIKFHSERLNKKTQDKIAQEIDIGINEVVTYLKSV